MVADLLTQRCDAQRWGFKAARLNEVAEIGLPVPPTLALRAEDLAQATDEAVIAIKTWLDLFRPRRLAIRTSAREDSEGSAEAGRTVSLLNCPPDASALLRVIGQDILVSENLGDPSRSSVMVQEQIEALFYGVAFYAEECLTVEATRYADGVTGGRAPLAYAREEGGRIHVATENVSFPGLLVTRWLVRVCRRLQRHFGFGVDMEWAWTGAAIIVLQVRPITESLHEGSS